MSAQKRTQTAKERTGWSAIQLGYERISLGPLGCLATLLLSPLLLVIGVPLAYVARWRGLNRFHREYVGQLILVWHSRGGWHDFCVNNLLPAVSGRVLAIQEDPAVSSCPDRRWLHAAEQEARVRTGARPYLVYVSPRTLRTASLNRALRPLKARAKKDPQVQAEVRSIVQTVIETELPQALQAAKPLAGGNEQS